jgi:hypothetical protein
MGAEILVPDRPPVPFPWTLMLDLSCVPAVFLIVEDEMMVRMRAVDMMEDAGYMPFEAALNADEAVAILESRSDTSR